MTPVEFVIWMKGIAETANPYNITPKQWEAIRERLQEVQISKAVPIGVGGWGTTTTAGDSYKVGYIQEEKIF